MNVPQQIAKHLREVYFGGNWTSSNLQAALKDVSWQHAIANVNSFNSIAALVFHTSYYVRAVAKVLEGEVLNAHDKFSFDHPPVQSEDDWQQLLNKNYKDATHLAVLVEQLPETRLWEPFADGKYGNIYRNLQGIIEHTHYHLGQIVLIKKWLLQSDQGS